ALEYYQKMLSQRGDDPKARSELGSRHLRVGLLRRKTGSGDEEIRHYPQGRELLEREISDREDGGEANLLLGRAYNDLALLLIDAHDYVEAQKVLERARQLVAKIVDTAPESFTAKQMMALTLNNIAWCVS